MKCSLHHFADGYEHGYAQVFYLYLVDNNGRIHCSMMIGKACVALLKVMPISRMELFAAIDVTHFEERIGNSSQ